MAPNPSEATQQTVTACVLIIGNEILSGRTQDVNLSHIANTIGAWGIQVQRAEVIADDEATIIEAVRRTTAAFDYVFTTGGIGPTHDDITAACIAKAFDVALVMSPEIEAVIRRFDAPEDVMASRLLMARVPEGADLIDNPTGGPQGFSIENVFVMAGIPKVMQAMLSTLDNRLRGGAVVSSRSIIAYLGESTIATALGAIAEQFDSVDIGSYPFFRDGRYGTNLVLRSADDAAMAQAYDAVWQAVEACGETPEGGDA